MNRSFLETQDLAVGYNGVPLIRDIALRLKKGEIQVLIGPNGAGKSTILKSLIRQLAPIHGAVLLDGNSMTELKGNALAKKLAVVQPGRTDSEYLTVREAVALGRYPYTGALGLLSEKDKKAVERAMEQVRVTDLADRALQQLSDGQRQRVLLARALCQEPELLVLDEPTTFLDIRYRLELLETLRQLVREENLSVLLSLHELDLAEQIADRVICVKGDRIYHYGRPEEVFVPTVLEELFDLPTGAWIKWNRPDRSCAETTEARPDGDRAPTAEGNPPTEGPEATAKAPAPFAHYVNAGSKQLRCGFTTGTCAALAAQACARRLLLGAWPATVALTTPKGWRVEVVPENVGLEGGTVHCAVRKFAGDDADRTADAEICAAVELRKEKGICIDGGVGVGRVTKPGLDQPVGAAAINSGPRRMITGTLEELFRELEYEGGASVTIYVPEGEEIAKHTFNPKLGIEGGISILGTSGIVEPMSMQALVDTIGVELRQARALGHDTVILTPGNYGLDFLRRQSLQPPELPVVCCSNFIGEALDDCGQLGFHTVLLVGHIGKLVKVAGGIMNTHSRTADCRAELFCAYAAVSGADGETCKALMDCVTTDACLEVLDRAELREPVLRRLTEAIGMHLKHRAEGRFRVGALCFSNEYGELGRTADAAEIVAEWTEATETTADRRKT